MRHRRHFACALWAPCLLWLSATFLAAQELPSQNPWPEWTAASQAWLRGQVAPTRVVPAPDPARRRLLLSYDLAPEKFPQGYHRSATYDNGLGVLAFLIAGDTDGAAFTLHALARLLRPDGSLRFSYNTANNWPDESYHESAIVRGGAVGWTGYAFTFFLAHAPPCAAGDRGCARERVFFRETAERLAGYLVSLQVSDPADPRAGLLRLGYGTNKLVYRPETDEVIEFYLDEPALGISTENNISAWFFLRQLAQLTGEPRWSEAADRIRRGLLQGAWNDELGQFNRGFDAEGAPDPVKALDCATWGALLLLAVGEPEKARRALQAVEDYYAARDGEAIGYRPYFDYPIYESYLVGRHFFPDDPRKQWRQLPLVWSEGSLGVALAYLRLGDAETARQVLAGLRPLQDKGTGLRYASRAVPHEMTDAPSVAASAWLVLVSEDLAGNPVAGEVWR